MSKNFSENPVNLHACAAVISPLKEADYQFNHEFFLVSGGSFISCARDDEMINTISSV